MKKDIYKLKSNNPTIEILIGSSSFFRELMLNPEISGSRFQKKFSTGLNHILKKLKESSDTLAASMINRNTVNILYILRGGLNFDIHNQLVLEDTYCEVSFCSSQRVIEDGNIYNSETSYSKWNLHDRSLLVIGDISATGTTIIFAITQAIEEYRKDKKTPLGILIITIGTINTIDVINNISIKLKKEFGSNFKGISVLFLEGVFYLNTGNVSYSKINLNNTDFFVKGYPRTIELELERINRPISLFERCVIYDGGSRSFEPKTYKTNLIKYWNKLYELSNSIDIDKFLEDRTDLFNYKKFLQKSDWTELLLSKNEYSKSEFIQKTNSTIIEVKDIGLKTLCEQRLEILTK